MTENPIELSPQKFNEYFVNELSPQKFNEYFVNSDYSVKIVCSNCKTINILNIPKGLRVSEALKQAIKENKKNAKCIFCDCNLRVNLVSKYESEQTQ